MLRNEVTVSWLLFTAIMLWGAGLVTAIAHILS
jgi:hypothetical protein